MMDTTRFEQRLKKYQSRHPVVQFDAGKDRLLKMDFTAANPQLTPALLADTRLLDAFVNRSINETGCRYGIGGYNELRAVYDHSDVFRGKTAGEEPRRLHLGIDIWGDAGTVVMAPLDGLVHSFAFNNRAGDYGPAVILRHEMDELVFYTLYGHLSVSDLDHLQEGLFIKAGDSIGHLGVLEENGQWPPHLHFQLIRDMEGMKGDYHGVCKQSEREHYLANCPDPDLLLGMMAYAV